MNKRTMITVICIIAAGALGFFIGRSRTASHYPTSDELTIGNVMVMNSAGEMSFIKIWLEALERGETNRLKSIMLRHLITQDMLLTGLLAEHPHATNAELASAVLVRTRRFIDQRVTGETKTFLEAGWKGSPIEEPKK